MWAAALGVAVAVLVWPALPALRPARRPTKRATARSPARRLRFTRRAETDLHHVALEILELVSPALSAGVPPAVAVSTCVDLVARPLREDDLRRELLELGSAARRGEMLSERWARLAHAHDVEALAVAAQAWSLSETLGCGLRASLETATALLRADDERRRRLRELTAGPRATMQLLTLLPVAGVGLCALMGISPAHLYAGQLMWVAVLPGCLLLVAGRLLVRRMIAAAGRAEALQ